MVQVLVGEEYSVPLVVADGYDDSDDLEMQADSIFDFTETDPFSEGNI